jgi:hypothetical protein
MAVQPGQVILEGDLIANPVYDPKRPLNFVVAGEFDLDHNGIIDRDGGGAVESLIRKWGGRIVTEVTPTTDFVVLGVPPRRPRGLGDPNAAGSGAGSGAAPAGTDAWTQYHQVVDAAKSMSVPVMNQSVFLNFLGYTGRQARR